MLQGSLAQGICILKAELATGPQNRTKCGDEYSTERKGITQAAGEAVNQAGPDVGDKPQV